MLIEWTEEKSTATRTVWTAQKGGYELKMVHNCRGEKNTFKGTINNKSVSKESTWNRSLEELEDTLAILIDIKTRHAKKNN